MIVHLRCEWHREEGGYLVTSDYPFIQGQSADKEYAVNFVKGACLHAIGDRRVVPRQITFTVVTILRPRKKRAHT